MNKRMMVAVLVAGALAAMAFAPAVHAEVTVAELTVTNGQAISYGDPINCAGWVDKIEFTQDSAATSTVTLATYSGTTAVDTFASLTTWSTATKLVRPRVCPTDNTGTALAYAMNNTGIGGTNVVTTLVMVPYQFMWAGGNLKLAVTGTANDGTNTVRATVYWHKSNPFGF